MGKRTKKRRQSHGSAWLWKQTDCWYFTPPGTRKRVALFDDKVEGGDVHHTFAVTYTTLLPQGATYREKRRSIFSRTRSHHATQLDFAQGLMWVRRSGASSLGTVAFSYSAYNSAVFMCFSAQTLHGGQANTRTGPRTKVDYCWLPSPSAGNSSCDALSTRYTRTSSPKIANTAL
jgi:hypothetical protein